MNDLLSGWISIWLFALFLAFSQSAAFSQIPNAQVVEPQVSKTDSDDEERESRAIYVNGFSGILGDATAEKKLLEYAKSHEMDTLLLYELHKVLKKDNAVDLQHNGTLASFISRAKTEYGVKRLVAVGEHALFFADVIDPYNNSRSNAEEKFDVYNLEFEFWIESRIKEVYAEPYLVPNGFASDEDGAFEFFLDSLKKMRALAKANAHDISIESYVGWTNGLSETKAAKVEELIAQNLDRVRVHAYRKRPDYGYTAKRLAGLAKGKPGLNVSIIFSAEKEFMSDWLRDNSMEAAESEFLKQFNDQATGKTKDDINLHGFTYYNYSHNVDVKAK